MSAPRRVGGDARQCADARKHRLTRSVTRTGLLVTLLAMIALGGSATAGAWGTSPCDLAYPSDSLVTWSYRSIDGRGTLESLFGDRWIDVARFNRIDRRHAVDGMCIKVPARLDAIECFTLMPSTYAAAQRDSQLILIDLSEQFLGAYEFGRLVFSAPVTARRLECHGRPERPALADARRLFEWVVGPRADMPGLHAIDGPQVVIVGLAPTARR